MRTINLFLVVMIVGGSHPSNRWNKPPLLLSENTPAAAKVKKTSATVVTTTQKAATKSSDSNPLTMIANSLKTSITTLKDGSVALYQNQRLSSSISRRYTAVPNSITYPEFKVMKTAASDRGKIIRIGLLLACGASNQLIYALYFFPEMVPSTYSAASSQSIRKKLEERERDVGIKCVQWALAFEQTAWKSGLTAKINPFSGSSEEKRKETVLENISLGKKVLAMSTGDEAIGEVKRAVDATLANLSRQPKNKKNTNFKFVTNLGTVPKPVLTFLGSTMSIPYASYIPNYFLRTQIKSKLQSIKEEDDFLTGYNLEDLEASDLREICIDRCCCRVGDDEEVLRGGVRKWLDDVNIFKQNGRKNAPEGEREAKEILGIAGLYGINAANLMKNGVGDIPGITLTRGLFVQ